mgnify:CR=1 FL=1
MHKIFFMAQQRNIRHFDRLLDDLGMGSLKKIPSTNVGFERFFFSRWSGSKPINLHHQESSASAKIKTIT